MSQVVTPSNLGNEFDIGNVEANRIRLKHDASIQRAADGTLSVDISGVSLTTTTTPIYEKCVIWAEENGALDSNQSEWSFGNGATGNIGITLAEDWEVYAVTFQADVSNAAATQFQMEIMNFATGVIVLDSIVLPNQGQINNFSSSVTLTTPLNFSAGDVLGFRTDIETGVVSDGRVAAWLRRKVADAITQVSLV